MNIVDDTLQDISRALDREEFLIFSRICRELKLVHRCIDGIGVNYTQNKITSIKAYCKILDTHPKFSNTFWRFFLQDAGFKSDFLELCGNQSKSLLKRDDGLAGINIAVKINTDNQKITKSAYVKTSKNKTSVINFSEKKSQRINYRYVFNPLLRRLINKLFQFHLPEGKYGLELSKKAGKRFCTAYPSIKNEPSDNPTRLSEKYKDFFNNLNSYDPWEIEDFQHRLPDFFRRKITPITKGYESKKASRKMFFVLFSYKHSLFDHLSESPSSQAFNLHIPQNP